MSKLVQKHLYTRQNEQQTEWIALVIFPVSIEQFSNRFLFQVLTFVWNATVTSGSTFSGTHRATQGIAKIESSFFRRIKNGDWTDILSIRRKKESLNNCHYWQFFWWNSLIISFGSEKDATTESATDDTCMETQDGGQTGSTYFWKVENDILTISHATSWGHVTSTGKQV